jgi:hypothetical protein
VKGIGGGKTKRNRAVPTFAAIDPLHLTRAKVGEQLRKDCFASPMTIASAKPIISFGTSVA